MERETHNRAAIFERVRDVVAQTFNCPQSLVTEATVAEDVPGWDSLTHTIFIMNVEAAFGIEFDLETVFSFDNVGDLVSALERIGAA